MTAREVTLRLRWTEPYTPGADPMTVEVVAVPEAAPDCAWTEDVDGVWQTGCGNSFAFTSGGVFASGVYWCMYCGHPIGVTFFPEPRPWRA